MKPHFLHQDAEQLLSLFCQSNPEITPLQVAENILLFDDLNDLFRVDPGIRLEDIKYQSSYGREDLRGELAAFLSRGFELDPVLSAADISCFSGTRCALDVAARALFGDLPAGERGILMPSPYWQGFEWIYEDRLEGSIVPVPLTSTSSFALTLDAIKAAYEGSQPRTRALVLTQPNNPLGVNYEPRLLEEIYQWVLEETEMQIFSDEIYAHCQMDGIRRSNFESALALPIARRYPDRVHVAWGFAKDFGLSGFRIGVLASRSANLQEAVRKTPLAGFSPMTSSNSWFLRKLFAPMGASAGEKPADRLMTELAPRLKASFQAASEALDRGRIPRFSRTDAAQFEWLDLRRWLDKVPKEPLSIYSLARTDLLESLEADPREKALTAYLAEEAGVSLLPGQTLSAKEPGFFRLCFTAVPRVQVVEAIDRVAESLRRLG